MKEDELIGYCYEIKDLGKGKPFRYVLSTYPVDDFTFALSFEEIIRMYMKTWRDCSEEYNDLKLKFDFMENIVCRQGENISSTHFFPVMGGVEGFDVAGIVKVSNNGTCFIFSNRIEYLELIIKYAEVENY